MRNEADLRLDGYSVLIVDDAPDNRLLVSRFLQLAGAKTDSAADGAQGICLALEKNFDVVLMDIQMPGMDGYEAVARLRAHTFSKPIVALTAHAMRSERERCLSSGFDAYLTKPIARMDLVRTILEMIKNYHERAKSITLPEDTPQDPELQRGPREVHQSPDHNRH